MDSWWTSSIQGEASPSLLALETVTAVACARMVPYSHAHTHVLMMPFPQYALVGTCLCFTGYYMDDCLGTAPSGYMLYETQVSSLSLFSRFLPPAFFVRLTLRALCVA